MRNSVLETERQTQAQVQVLSTKNMFAETGAIKERQRMDLKKANCTKFASYTQY